MLEGHHHLATSLVFSPDGKYIAAVDADENRMFCWRFPTGLLSFIGGATDAEGKPVMAKSSHEFANRRGVGMVGVEVSSLPWLIASNTRLMCAWHDSGSRTGR